MKWFCSTDKAQSQSRLSSEWIGDREGGDDFDVRHLTAGFRRSATKTRIYLRRGTVNASGSTRSDNRRAHYRSVGWITGGAVELWICWMKTRSACRSNSLLRGSLAMATGSVCLPSN
jgi:hypothetical protein